MRYGTAAARWVIIATVLGSGMAAIDATVVGIALPTIGREFHSNLGALQWVVTGYSLTLSALLLLGGSLGDHFGRRRIFMLGVLWFAIASAACALAPNVEFLIATRIFQGIGAALLTPGSLAILQASFDAKDRGRAIGAWSGLGGVATAAGPLLGGYLIAAASWRWIFIINVPLGAAVMFLSARYVPESRDPTSGRHVDVFGAFTATIALAGLTYGLIESPTFGWGSPRVAIPVGIGLIGVGAFVLLELRTKTPMLPLSMFKVRQFTVTNAVTFIVYAALGGSLFLLPVQLQISDHYSPLKSGMALLPITFIMLVLSSRSGRLASRIGPRLQMSVGPVVVGVGLAMLVRVTSHISYVAGALPAVIVFGLGLAITVAPLTSTALGSVPAEHAGLASAVNNDVARIGSLLAVAILPALAGISGNSYLHPGALSNGFRLAVVIAGSLCVVGGVLAGIGIENPHRRSLGQRKADATVQDISHHCALDAPPSLLTESETSEL